MAPTAAPASPATHAWAAVSPVSGRASLPNSADTQHKFDYEMFQHYNFLAAAGGCLQPVRPCQHAVSSLVSSRLCFLLFFTVCASTSDLRPCPEPPAAQNSLAIKCQKA